MVLIIKQVKFHLPKLMLFFSAYSPLFLILAINYFEFPTVAIFDLSSMQSIIHFLLSLVTVNKITIILLILVIIPNYIFYHFYKSESGTTRKFKIEKSENLTKDMLSYLIPFVVAILPTDFFGLNSIKGILSFLIIIVLLYSIYINSDLLLLNPILPLFNMKIYRVNEEKENILVLTRKNSLENGKIESCYRITKDLYKI